MPQDSGVGAGCLSARGLRRSVYPHLWRQRPQNQATAYSGPSGDGMYRVVDSEGTDPPSGQFDARDGVAGLDPPRTGESRRHCGGRRCKVFDNNDLRRL